MDNAGRATRTHKMRVKVKTDSQTVNARSASSIRDTTLLISLLSGLLLPTSLWALTLSDYKLDATTELQSFEEEDEPEEVNVEALRSWAQQRRIDRGDTILENKSLLDSMPLRHKKYSSSKRSDDNHVKGRHSTHRKTSSHPDKTSKHRTHTVQVSTTSRTKQERKSKKKQ
jgi:hypothetical protein